MRTRSYPSDYGQPGQARAFRHDGGEGVGGVQRAREPVFPVRRDGDDGLDAIEPYGLGYRLRQPAAKERFQFLACAILVGTNEPPEPVGVSTDADRSHDAQSPSSADSAPAMVHFMGRDRGGASGTCGFCALAVEVSQATAAQGGTCSLRPRRA
jgi:hypothetical protein